MNKSEQINELAAALAKAQAAIENAHKSSANPHFKSKYADLAEVLNTVRPVLAANGLSVAQFPGYEAGVVSVETILMHSSGQWLSGVISAPVGKQDAQGIGSATTYCRRYSLAAVTGIAQEDDDANGAVGHTPKREPAKVTPAKSAKVELVGAEQLAHLRAALVEAGMDEAQLCAKVRIDALEQLAAERVAGALSYLAQQAKEQAA